VAEVEYHCSPQHDVLPKKNILIDSNLFLFQYTCKATWKNHSLAWKHMAPNFEADKVDIEKVHNIIYLGQHSSLPFNGYFLCKDLQTCQDCATLVLSLWFLFFSSKEHLNLGNIVQIVNMYRREAEASRGWAGQLPVEALHGGSPAKVGDLGDLL
jgi:hypothetical protein